MEMACGKCAIAAFKTGHRYVLTAGNSICILGHKPMKRPPPRRRTGGRMGRPGPGGDSSQRVEGAKRPPGRVAGNRCACGGRHAAVQLGREGAPGLGAAVCCQIGWPVNAVRAACSCQSVWKEFVDGQHLFAVLARQAAGSWLTITLRSSGTSSGSRLAALAWLYRSPVRRP